MIMMFFFCFSFCAIWMYPVEVLHPTKTYLPGLKNQLQWFLLLKVEVMDGGV